MLHGIHQLDVKFVVIFFDAVQMLTRYVYFLNYICSNVRQY